MAPTSFPNRNGGKQAAARNASSYYAKDGRSPPRTGRMLPLLAGSSGENKSVLRCVLTTVIHDGLHCVDGVVDCTLPDRQSILEGNSWFPMHRSDESVRRFAGLTGFVDYYGKVRGPWFYPWD